jgi:hypothetical protein
MYKNTARPTVRQIASGDRYVATTSSARDNRAEPPYLRGFRGWLAGRWVAYIIGRSARVCGRL